MPAAPEIEMPHYEPTETELRGEAGPERLEAVACGQCGVVNSGARKFCTGCGSRMQAPCPHCQAVCAAGEKFCGACGVHLAAAVQHELEQFEANLAAVEQFRDQDRYEEAMALLGPMTRLEHPRLNRHVARAAQIVRQLVTQRERHRAAAAAAFEKGQALFAENAYDEAAGVLGGISAALRDDRFRNLLAEAEARRDEIARLGHEVRASLAAKQAAQALALIERLLALRPGHAGASRLAAQLEERFCRAAEHKLARGQYEEALKLLRQVPDALAAPALAQRRGRAADWAWLAANLRSAPLLDAPLLAMARRLRELAPKDAASAKLIAQLERRAARAAEAGQLQPPPWAAAPERPALGLPVDALATFRRIEPAEAADRKLLADGPARFAVACGLALQGLEKAHLGINLLPSDRRGVLDAVAQKLLKRPATAAWGIDVGATSVKAVRLAWDAKRQTAVLETLVHVEHRKPLHQAANAEEQRALVEETMAALVAEHKLRGVRIGLGLPGRFTTLRHFRLPAVEPARLAAMVRHEAPRQLPVRLDDLIWGHQALAPPPDGDPSGPRTAPVVFCGARRELVTPWVEAATPPGFHYDFLQSECLALHNFRMFEQSAWPPAEVKSKPDPVAAKSASKPDPAPAKSAPPEKPAPVETVALVDVGGDGGSFIVSSPCGVWCRPIGFGGYSITRALVKEFGVTLAEAEQLQRNPVAAPSIARFYREIDPVLDDFAKEIELCLSTYAKSGAREPVARLIGTGGGFQLHGLLRRLRRA